MLGDYISGIRSKDFERVNMDIIERNDDIDLVQHIVDACKSLGIVRYVEYVDHEYITDERLIDTDAYVRRRNGKKNPKRGNYVDNNDRIITMHDSRYSELRVKFKLSCKGETKFIVKNFLIPVRDKDGYYTIKGKKFFMIYQLVDASTYTKGQSVILKSLMPISVNRNSKTVEDIRGNEYTGYVYDVTVFRKDINIMLFYLAKMGIGAFTFMNIHEVVSFIDGDEEIDTKDDDIFIYFRIRRSLHMRVVRVLFEKHLYLRSIVITFLDNTSNRLTLADIHSKQFWIEKIGNLSGQTKSHLRYNTGLNTMMVFERMLDITTRRTVRVSIYNKSDIYTITRWMIQNFERLKRKDDVDIKNKRLRSNESIASLFTHQISLRVKRILDYGNRIDIDRLEDAMKIPGDIIVQQLRSPGGLMKFDDKINDMDLWTKLKYTIKGPHSMGNKNPRSIANKYRDIHPSFIGAIDINVCGTSDPGASGTLTPWVKTDGLYLDDRREPEDGSFDYDMSLHENPELLQEINEDVLVRVDNPEDTPEDIIDRQNKMQEITDMIYINKTYHNEINDDDGKD